MFLAEEINVRVKHKGMTLAEWNKSTIILMERELGVATDTGEVRVGNGTDKWTNLPIIKGEKGEPLKVESTIKNSQGDTVIKFDDGSSATVSKGDKGDSIKVESHEKDGQGNTVINFSDGSNITVDKGDSIKVESTSTDNQGNTLVKFSDGSSATIAKGDKGDPLKFEDLTQEQINQIKAKDVDMSNYATKDDLASVDVSDQLQDYAKKDHTHRVQDMDDWNEIERTFEYYDEKIGKKAEKGHTHEEYIRSVGVNARGQIVYTRDNKEWKLQTIDTTYGNELALKNHTHDEYIKKGDPIELTPEQKAELKGADGLTTFIRYANNPSGYNMTFSPQSDTTHIGIFSSEGRVAPPTPSVYQWTKIKGEPGKQGLPGQAGKGIVNTRTGTELKYWAGSQADYNRISTKDPNTVYDVWE